MSSEKTPNLQLHKWQASDYVLRTEFNDNFAKIDDHAKQVTEQLAETSQKLGEYLTVESFPRIAPETNDTGRLQRAINQAISKGVKLILTKRYTISSPVYVPAGTNGFIMEGLGEQTGIVNTGTGNALELRGSGNVYNDQIKKIKIRNFYIGGTLSSGHGLCAEGVTEASTFSDLIIKTHGGDGLHLLDCWGSHVIGCHVSSCERALYLDSGNGVTIAQNWFTVCRSHLIQLDICAGTMITGNVIASTPKHQIYVNFGSSLVIEGNNMENYDSSKNELGQGIVEPSIFVEKLSTGVTIKNNLIWRSGSGAQNSIHPLVKFQNAHFCEIGYNWIRPDKDMVGSIHHIEIDSASRNISILKNYHEGSGQKVIDNGLNNTHDYDGLLNSTLDSLIVNSKFRNWNNGANDVPDRWVKRATDTVTRVSGVNELYAVSLTSADSNLGFLEQRITDEKILHYLRGKEIYVQANVKTNAHNRQRIRLEVNGQNHYSVYHNGDGTFKTMSIRVKLPDTITSLTLSPIYISSGTSVTVECEQVIFNVGGVKINVSENLIDVLDGGVDKMVLVSPNGTRYKLTVDDTGALATTTIS